MPFFQPFQNVTGNTPLTRRRALVGLSLLILTACSRSASKTDPAGSDVAYYTCGMHPFVRSQDPSGKCPVCGMGLVAVLKSDEPSSSTAASRGSIAYIAPERLQEIGATTEVITKRAGSVQPLSIPAKAVLPTGDKFIAFVDHGDGQVEPREVKLKDEAGGYYKVISGVQDGDRVFVSGNYLIDAECRMQGVLKTWGDRP